MKRVILVCVFILLLFPIVNAGKYGEVEAWFKKTDGEWQNATATPTLKIGEPFWIKINMTAEENAALAYRLKEPGETKAFEVIEGPSKLGEAGHLGWKDANWSNTYQWKLKTTGNWSYGNAPLNILVKFTIKDYGDLYDDRVRFSIVNAYISSEEWEGSETETVEDYQENTKGKLNQNSEEKDFPWAYVGGGSLIILIIIGIWLYKRNRYY